MTTVGNMKQHVASLVETNRALAAELQASRAAVAKMTRERDSLRRKLAGLQSEWQRAMLVEEARDQRAAADTQALIEELNAVENERDESRAELAEAIGALNEICNSLRSRLLSIESSGEPAQPSYM